MTADGYEVDLVKGIGQYLAARGHGVWRDDGVYADGETAIVLDVMPQKPDNAIVLAPYGVADDPSQADTITGLQVRTRAAGRATAPVRAMTANLFLELHGRTGLLLSTGLQVVQILRQSTVSDGQDENGRWSVIQNFYCDLHVPAMHVFTD